jgi:hypothetical protein
VRVKPRPNGKFLTLKQAELEYGIPYARLYVWVIDKRLPHLKEGRSYYARRTDLEAFLESITVRS